ncbi:MAG: M48 family metallopeptidase [Pseudomonadota bacterium]
MQTQTWQNRLQQKIAERHFQSIVASTAQDLRPKPTPLTIAVQVMACAILLTPIPVAALGVWIILTGDFSWVGTIVGGCVLGVAWVLLPPAGRLGHMPLTRAEMPALFDLIDELADRMGAPRVDVLVVDASFNAFMARVGWRRSRVLGIGLAMWQILEHDERLAILAHELAHEVNADPARGVLVGSAEHTLQSWIQVWLPGPRDTFERHAGTLEALAELGMEAVGRLLILFLRGFYLLRMRESQRAEFYADLLAAKTAGTGPMISALQKLVSGDFVAILAQRAIPRGDGAGAAWMRGLKQQLTETYADHINQAIGNLEKERSSIDESHPPTHLRIALLKTHERYPSTDLSVDWAQIDAELEPFLESAGRAVMSEPGLL